MYDLEEQEKIDALKDWWKQNGRSVIAGVVVFVLALGGGQGYRYWKQKQREQAAVLYDAVVAGAKQKKLKDALDAARSIEETFPSSGFAARAALVAAKAAFEGGDRVGARAQLEWASDHADEVPIRNIARLRLAGVLADDRKYDEALTRLSSVDDSRFSALAADLRGDILLAQGKVADARKAYRAAIDAAAGSQQRQFTQTKLDALGEGS